MQSKNRYQIVKIDNDHIRLTMSDTGGNETSFIIGKDHMNWLNEMNISAGFLVTSALQSTGLTLYNHEIQEITDKVYKILA